MTIRLNRLIYNIHYAYYMPKMSQVLRTQDKQDRLNPYTVEPTVNH